MKQAAALSPAIPRLNEEDIQRIDEATARIIARTGFRVSDRELRELADKAGAEVSESDERVKIPEPLLRKLLETVPDKYRICGASGRSNTIGDGEQRCLAIVTDPWIVDYETGVPRHPSLADIQKHTAIAEQLGCVTSVSLMEYPVTDYPDKTSTLRAMETFLVNHDKHINVMPASLESWALWLDVGSLLTAPRELAGSDLYSVAVAVQSPLALSKNNCRILVDACEYGFPVVPTICPMAGSTGPYTHSGVVLQGNVEALFVAALAQIVRPGNPVLYSFGPSITDLRNGDDLYYTVDKVLLKTAGVQMGQSYKIPTTAECGGS